MVRRLVDRWQDRAAVRSEHELEPTLRRQFDRWPQRGRSWRARRTERRARQRSSADIDGAVGRAYGKNPPFGW